ncbi:MAG: insulinase family protein [Pyrinomonadaceae bacterium]|nr:insulinase family protein [Pyrinomonadaceae bacterium]MCX7640459.1 insulinase family protein [Pyrinomonadaceae bacterium]MDW8304886.1 insulinase family protein [Acidobacteriota bacterium]
MRRACFTIGVFLLTSTIIFSQQLPRQEQLLNGLKLLIWEDRLANKMTVKVRIHKGAAFDLKDKEGMMALLSDILFADGQSEKLFREDFAGKLDVTVNYDYIQIDALGKTENFLAMLEILANSLINPPITKENFKKVYEARLAKIENLEKKDSYVADLAVRKRLLGTFPYGRSIEGTAQSLKNIELADLIFAKERYLTADNATLIISGNLKSDFVYMAARRIFGPWKKSERPIPYSFRQPDEPDTSLLEMASTDDNLIEARSALRGVARSDKNFFTAQILARVLSERLKRESDNSAVIHQGYFLPGILISKLSLSKASSNEEFSSEKFLPKFSLSDLMRESINTVEFEKAKSDFLKDFNATPHYDLWLDLDTYGLVSLEEEKKKAESVSLQDVVSLLEEFRKRPIVNVVLIKR